VFVNHMENFGTKLFDHLRWENFLAGSSKTGSTVFMNVMYKECNILMCRVGSLFQTWGILR
jgi:hypothetical protein